MRIEGEEMISNCPGCKEDLAFAYECQCDGLFVATAKNHEFSYPNGKNHYFICMVDENGIIRVGDLDDYEWNKK